MNQDQIKKLSDTLTILAYSQFGVFGYEVFKRQVWISEVWSALLFLVLQGVAIWISKFPRGDET